VSVRIRMKKFGRKHQPYFRICAMDIRKPRDGRVLEELGSYDPLIPETDARAILNGERIKYWLSVGAQPSVKVTVLIKKYGLDGTHLAAQQQALGRLAIARRRPEPMAALPRPPKPAKRPRDDEAAPAKGRRKPPVAETAAAEAPAPSEAVATEQTEQQG
jgi:small subunit ribosomal protein S16